MHIEGTVIREGKSVQEAVAKGLRSLGIKEEQANIEVLSPGKPGFFGFGAKPARVRIAIKAEIVNELKLKDILVDLNIADMPLENIDTLGEISAAAEPSICDENDGMAAANIDPEVHDAEEAAGDNETMPAEKKAGTVKVCHGNIIVKDPVNDDLYAAIKPDLKTRLTVNGIPVTEETIIREQDEIQLELVHDEAVSTLDLRVSKNKMEADLKLVIQPGARYKLRDQAPANNLVLMTDVESIIEPSVPTPDEVKLFLQDKGIIRGVDEKAIMQVIENPNSKERFTIARGMEPVDGENAYIRYPFLESIDEDLEEGYFGRNKLVSVNAEDIIAIKVPAREGIDGWNVEGEVLPAKPPVDCQITVKSGCELIDDGNQVVATINGRPVIEPGLNQDVIYVDPIYVVKEVSQATGDIKFAGDVEVQGDVKDGCTVEADGNIQVMGDVTRASIKAGTNVILHKMVLGSTIIAGGRAALYSSVISLFKQIQEMLTKLCSDANQVKAKSGFGVNTGTEVHDGPIIQFLIDTRYRSLVKTIEELSAALLNSGVAAQEEVADFAIMLQKKFCGLGATEISRIDFLDDMQTILAQVTCMIDTYLKRMDYIKVRYVQNCALLSSGDVIIEGQGCYISAVRAGGEVIICGKPGVARGVKILARGNVTVNDLGSDFETQTHVRSDIGRIAADLVHSDVLIQIGRDKYRVDKDARSFSAYIDSQGKLMVDKLSAETKGSSTDG